VGLDGCAKIRESLAVLSCEVLGSCKIVREVGLIVEGRATCGGQEVGGEVAKGIEDIEVSLSINGALLSLLILMVSAVLVGAKEVVG
jgi:hypothetical protein